MLRFVAVPPITLQGPCIIRHKLRVYSPKQEYYSAYTQDKQSLTAYIQSTSKVLCHMYTIPGESHLACILYHQSLVSAPRTAVMTWNWTILWVGLSIMHPVSCVSHGGTPYPVSRISSTLYSISCLLPLSFVSCTESAKWGPLKKITDSTVYQSASCDWCGSPLQTAGFLGECFNLQSFEARQSSEVRIGQRTVWVGRLANKPTSILSW